MGHILSVPPPHSLARAIDFDGKAYDELDGSVFGYWPFQNLGIGDVPQAVKMMDFLLERQREGVGSSRAFGRS